MQEPFGANKSGIIKGYMCKISFDYELGNDAHGTKIYPSVDSLKERERCSVGGCGIVEVELREFIQQEEDWPFQGYMEHVQFNYEAGKAPLGAVFYPSEATCRKHEPYTKKYGVVRVQVRKSQIVQEEDEEKMIANSVKSTELDKWRKDKNYHPLNNAGEPAVGLGGPDNWNKFFRKESNNVE